MSSSKCERQFQSTRQVWAVVTHGGADESGENSVLADPPLRATAKIKIGVATRMRVRQKRVAFSKNGPLGGQLSSQGAACKPVRD